MPNINVCIYLNDKEFKEYKKKKEELNKIARAAFKKAMER